LITFPAGVDEQDVWWGEGRNDAAVRLLMGRERVGRPGGSAINRRVHLRCLIIAD